MTENYYVKRKEALAKIDKMLLEGKKKEAIIYYITGQYGFSEKIVLERIKQFEKLNEE